MGVHPIAISGVTWLSSVSVLLHRSKYRTNSLYCSSKSAIRVTL